MTDEPQVSRRTAILAGGGALGATLLAGCATGDGGEDAGGGGGPPSDSAGKDSALADVKDIPVGGSVRVESGGKPVVLSQPEKGTIKAFSAICTHQGCTVAADGAKLRCPCHGSVYDAATGKVLGGPAPRPLPPVAVEVHRGTITAGTG